MHDSIRSHGLWLLLIGFLLAEPLELLAQFQTGRTSTSRSRGTTREYNNAGEIGEAMISSDPETRRIIVIADEETQLHISQVITNLDRPKPQVLIKVVFLEVTHNNSLDFGVQGQYTHKINDTTTGDAKTAFGLGPLASLPGAGGVYQVVGQDFEVIVRALAEAGKTEVLSRPSILARNNQEAVITVGQEVPFITNTRITDTGQQINTIQYQDIGIILRVTPFITSDGLVEMIVAPEISTLTDDTVPISDTVDARVIAKRSAETVVVTPDGRPVIIGGLMENKKIDTVRKVPLLGDIPVLGVAFRRKIKEDTKTELIIILTPHIVMQPSQLAAMSQREAQQNELLPKAFSDAQLDRFLDGLPVKSDQAPQGGTTSTKKSSSKKSKSSGTPSHGAGALMQ